METKKTVEWVQQKEENNNSASQSEGPLNATNKPKMHSFNIILMFSLQEMFDNVNRYF